MTLKEMEALYVDTTTIAKESKKTRFHVYKWLQGRLRSETFHGRPFVLKSDYEQFRQNNPDIFERPN